MSDNNSTDDHKPTGSDDAPSISKDIPEQLPGDPKRQAVDPLHGYCYQAWWSIDAWLRLTDEGEVIYLEGAEDFDVVSHNGARTFQIKKNVDTISLGTAKAHEFLENFWKLSTQEPTRRIDFHYLTTSSIALESDAPFGDIKGIELWRAAQTSLELTTDIAQYLSTKLKPTSPLKQFLSTAKPEVIQEQLIKRFHWLANQPDIGTVKRSVKDRITTFLAEQRRSLSLTQQVSKYLESRFWEIVLKPESSQRVLTRAELLRQIETATTAYLPVPIDQIPDLIGTSSLGLNLFNLLLEKLPSPPEPLLQRPTLTQHLKELINHRKVVMLTGTVYKGKTTVAQLIASKLCPDAWWINLSERRHDQVDNILLALAGQIESGECPSLIVIDDLDISPSAHRVYNDSLTLLLHRANATGRGVLLTARGESSDKAIFQNFDNIEFVDVPELTSEETEALSIEHGCPREIAKYWGPLITVWTGGHPKLIQVRLAELADRGWPKPNIDDVTTQSSAVASARQLARQLLSESVASPVAEFVYLVSDCTVPIHRSIAIRLAENVNGISNGGDVLDNLTGKWIEKLDNELFRSTALIKNTTADVWSPEKIAHGHIRIHDAILAKHTLDPFEAAALIFHAYMGKDSRRLAKTAMQLQMLKGSETLREVDRNLLWLPLIALDSGQTITDDVIAGLVLRALQFRVATTLDSELIPKICARWEDEVEKLSQPTLKAVNQSLLWFSTGFAKSPRVPLQSRFNAIASIPTIPKHISQELPDLPNLLFNAAKDTDQLPEDGTTAQAILLCAHQSIQSLDSFNELLQWLNNEATDETRQQFDEMLEWPLIQTLGAFVHGAWIAAHEETKNWEPWLTLYNRVNEYAKKQNSFRLGREAAKARAIILTEYLSKPDDALKILDQAEADFGLSPVLMEQRANVKFQSEDDKTVLDIWHQLISDPSHKTTLDPFAYRRAGISASRLKLWDKAAQIFQAAVDSVNPGLYVETKFGLQIDTALVNFLGGDKAAATMILANAVMSLPVEAAEEDNEKWDAVQRAAASFCSTLENSYWKSSPVDSPFEPGYASSPELKVLETKPGQAARTEMTKVQILHLVATTSTEASRFADDLEKLSNSKYRFVRWIAIEAQFAHIFSIGAGSGFIEKLIDFDIATIDFLANHQQSELILEPDKKIESSPLPAAPERWFGMLCAGLVCSGPELLSHINIWLDASSKLLGEEAPLTNNIRLLLEGVTLPDELLLTALSEETKPKQVRCGAAATLLRKKPPADMTLQLQAFLISGALSDESSSRQILFNRHAARALAISWRTHAQSPFQFRSPGKSVDLLLNTLSEVERGNATLKSLLESAAYGLGQPLGEFLEHVQ